MGTDWRLGTLADVAVFENRLRIPLSAPERSRRLGPYPYWGANGPFDTVDEYLFEGPRVLVAEDGSVLRPDGRGYVHWADGRYWVNNHAHVLSVGDGHHLRWMYFALLGAQVRDLVSGSVQPKLSMGSLKRLPLAIPPSAQQRAIVDVLGALDDKIESNRRTADAARAVLMQAPPSTGESSPLDQAADFHNGGALTKHATGSGRPILRIKELRAGVRAETPRTDTPVRETHEVAGGDLLFSWSGTLLTTRWCGEPAVLNQHVFRVDPRPGLSRWFVEACIERHLNTFRAIAADKATTMGHIQRRHLTETLVALPPRDKIEALMRTYDPLDHLRMSLLAEAERLAAIRDALLPRLVSGRIRVPLTNDRDEAVETVVDAA